nr:unnamed protein product [Callosobruchus chinensis]
MLLKKRMWQHLYQI